MAVTSQFTQSETKNPVASRSSSCYADCVVILNISSNDAMQRHHGSSSTDEGFLGVLDAAFHGPLKSTPFGSGTAGCCAGVCHNESTCWKTSDLDWMTIFANPLEKVPSGCTVKGFSQGRGSHEHC